MKHRGWRNGIGLLCLIVVMSFILGTGAAATAAELSSAQKDAKPTVDSSSRAVAQTDGARSTGGTVGESVPLPSGSSVKECDGVTSLKGSAMALVRRLAGKPTSGPGQCPPGEAGLLEHIVK